MPDKVAKSRQVVSSDEDSDEEEKPVPKVPDQVRTKAKAGYPPQANTNPPATRLSQPPPQQRFVSAGKYVPPGARKRESTATELSGQPNAQQPRLSGPSYTAHSNSSQPQPFDRSSSPPFADLAVPSFTFSLTKPSTSLDGRDNSAAGGKAGDAASGGGDYDGLDDAMGMRGVETVGAERGKPKPISELLTQLGPATPPRKQSSLSYLSSTPNPYSTRSSPSHILDSDDLPTSPARRSSNLSRQRGARSTHPDSFFDGSRMGGGGLVMRRAGTLPKGIQLNMDGESMGGVGLGSRRMMLAAQGSGLTESSDASGDGRGRGSSGGDIEMGNGESFKDWINEESTSTTVDWTTPIIQAKPTQPKSTTSAIYLSNLVSPDLTPFYMSQIQSLLMKLSLTFEQARDQIFTTFYGVHGPTLLDGSFSSLDVIPALLSQRLMGSPIGIQHIEIAYTVVIGKLRQPCLLDIFSSLVFASELHLIGHALLQPVVDAITKVFHNLVKAYQLESGRMSIERAAVYEEVRKLAELGDSMVKTMFCAPDNGGFVYISVMNGFRNLDKGSGFAPVHFQQWTEPIQIQGMTGCDILAAIIDFAFEPPGLADDRLAEGNPTWALTRLLAIRGFIELYRSEVRAGLIVDAGLGWEIDMLVLFAEGNALKIDADHRREQIPSNKSSTQRHMPIQVSLETDIGTALEMRRQFAQSITEALSKQGPGRVTSPWLLTALLLFDRWGYEGSEGNAALANEILERGYVEMGRWAIWAESFIARSKGTQELLEEE